MISPHKYTYQISLHEKCVAILQTKLKAIERLDNARGALAEYKAAKDRYAPIRLYNTEDSLQAQIDWYEKVVARISSYYRKQSLQLCRIMLDVEAYDQEVYRVKPAMWCEGNRQVCDINAPISELFNNVSLPQSRTLRHNMLQMYEDAKMDAGKILTSSSSDHIVRNAFEELTNHPINYGMAELTSHLIEPTNVPYDTATN